MAVDLLDLSNGRVSLECDEEDLPQVRAAIARLYGAPTTIDRAAKTDVRFGGETFIFQNDWNDPCLISCSPGGDACLRRVFAELHGEDG